MGDNAVKKIIKIIVPLVLIFVCVTGAFAQGTLSEEILNQAKREAGLFLELKSALGLDWLDEYNAYLENPTSNPEPSWDLSVADLVNGGYLSDSFPSDFTITKAGQEVKISKIITSQAMKDVLPIYLPSVTIAGDVVSLIVQRPEQWVAYEAALNGKVDRDGSGNPDILPDASLDFGAGASINFLSNDGKLLGINSLIYKGEEADIRFVNAAGDNMTGQLTINGNKVWHAGNDGSGSGLDADLLDGKDSSFFTNAGNLNSGIVPVACLSGTYNINISGRASIATNADYASNSDKLDGKDSSDFALSGHTHGYVSKKGDTMTGNLSFNSPSNVGIVGNPNTWTKIDPNGQRFIVTIPGSLTDGNPNFPVIDLERTDNWQHLWELKANGDMTVRGNPVWHAGNDGPGSGLDSDLLDGYHAGEFVKKSGDTATGPIYFRGGLSAEAQSKDDITTRTPSGFWQTNSATTGEGWPQTTNTWYHLLSSTHSNTGNYYAMQFAGNFYNSNDIYYRSTNGSGTTPWNKMWHSGNDGSGSGLDADLLDGKHISELSSMFGGLTPNGVKTYSSPGTYTWTKNPGTKYVFVQVVGGGGGGGGKSAPGIPGTGGTGGTSSFGSYCYATGGGGGGSSNREGRGYNGDINKCGSSPRYYVEYSGSHTYYHVTFLGYSPFDYSVGRGGLPNSKYDWYAGCGGGYAAKFVDVSDVNSVTVTVGAGGAGGMGWGGHNGNPGTPGIVIVHEFK